MYLTLPNTDSILSIYFFTSIFKCEHLTVNELSPVKRYRFHILSCFLNPQCDIRRFDGKDTPRISELPAELLHHDESTTRKLP